jgi:hypothetical protein
MVLSFIYWIVGGLLAFAFGIWAGLGYPGRYKREDPGGPSREGRMGTWMNKWIFGGPRPRRFSTKHLIIPGKAKNRREGRGVEPTASDLEERPAAGDE